MSGLNFKAVARMKEKNNQFQEKNCFVSVAFHMCV